jgi:hypothetical protein
MKDLRRAGWRHASGSTGMTVVTIHRATRSIRGDAVSAARERR